MYIGNFLQLERTFKSNGEIRSPAEIEKVIGFKILFRDLFGVAVSSPGNALQAWEYVTRSASHFFTSSGESLPHRDPKKRSKNIESRQLGGKRLGRGHADFRTGMGIDHAVGLTACCRAHHIADGYYCRTPFFRFAHGRKCVRGLTRLGNGDEQIVLALLMGCDIGTPMQYPLQSGSAASSSNMIFSNQSCMPRRAAGDDKYFFAARSRVICRSPIPQGE